MKRYEGLSAKSQEHLRRNSVPLSSYVDIHNNCSCVFKQDRYFSLTDNKVSFIKFLLSELVADNIAVINCSGEADTKVVKSAIDFAKQKRGPCVVVCVCNRVIN